MHAFSEFSKRDSDLVSPPTDVHVDTSWLEACNVMNPDADTALVSVINDLGRAASVDGLPRPCPPSVSHTQWSLQWSLGSKEPQKYGWNCINIIWLWWRAAVVHTCTAFCQGSLAFFCCCFPSVILVNSLFSKAIQYTTYTLWWIMFLEIFCCCLHN